MIVTAEIGMGEVLLALIPTVNLIAMALVYRLTHKTKSELMGEVSDQAETVTDAVSHAQRAVQTDLKNGIRNRVDTVIEKVEQEVIPRLDRKKERLDGIESQLAELTDKVANIE